MGAKASVSKITVSVGKHTFDLTLEEARALKDELNKVLEPKVTFPVRDRVERIIEREVPRIPFSWERPAKVSWGDVVCRADSPSTMDGALKPFRKDPLRKFGVVMVGT